MGLAPLTHGQGRPQPTDRVPMSARLMRLRLLLLAVCLGLSTPVSRTGQAVGLAAPATGQEAVDALRQHYTIQDGVPTLQREPPVLVPGNLPGGIAPADRFMAFGFPLLLLAVLLALALSLLPTWLAVARHHPQVVAIAALNVVCGLTLVGWVGALLWASSAPRRVPPSRGTGQA